MQGLTPPTSAPPPPPSHSMAHQIPTPLLINFNSENAYSSSCLHRAFLHTYSPLVPPV